MPEAVIHGCACHVVLPPRCIAAALVTLVSVAGSLALFGVGAKARVAA